MKKHNGRKLIYWYLAKTSFKGNRSISLFFTKDTFNKLGYKAEINNYTASRIN